MTNEPLVGAVCYFFHKSNSQVLHLRYSRGLRIDSITQGICRLVFMLLWTPKLLSRQQARCDARRSYEWRMTRYTSSHRKNRPFRRCIQEVSGLVWR